MAILRHGFCLLGLLVAVLYLSHSAQAMFLTKRFHLEMQPGDTRKYIKSLLMNKRLTHAVNAGYYFSCL
jgi:hypothetical protein